MNRFPATSTRNADIEPATRDDRPSASEPPITLLIPMRDFRDAKSRLTWLDDEARIALARRCFERSLVASVSAEGFVPVVISESPSVSAHAREHGVPTIRESARSYNFRSVLQDAVTDDIATPSFGILMADLPYVSAEDLNLARRHLANADVVLAPDRHGLGTNLMLSRIRAAGLLRFGAQDSFLQHVEALRSQCLSCHVMRLFGLGFDVDTNEDYQALSER